MGEKQELLQSAQNLLEQAARAKMTGNEKLARKLVEGAKRLRRWSEEGMPEHLR